MTEGRDVARLRKQLAQSRKTDTAMLLPFWRVEALFAVVEAAQEALPWVGVSEDRRGHWPPTDVRDNLRDALAALDGQGLVADDSGERE